MKLFAIYGDPVAHSKSPLMHNYLFRHQHYPALYTRIRLSDGSRLREDFLRRKLDGANVTVPHKEAAFAACDEVRGFAQKAGVVNTILNESGRLIGYNTDADGFLLALDLLATPIESVLLLGAGGTAKALVPRLLEAGKKVTLLNRSAGRLQTFAEMGCQADTWEGYQSQPFDLIVNTTSAGLDDTALPAPEAILKDAAQTARCAIDVIYGKTTPFLELMHHFGLQTLGGEAMLIGQGVLASRLFTQKRFSEEETYRAFQAALSL